MGLWSRLGRALGWPTKDELAGARLNDPDAWAVPPAWDAPRFFRALPMLFPASGVVYLEGTTERAFAEWLAARATPASLKIAPHTAWPRQDTYHVPLTPSFMSDAAKMVDRGGIVLPALHVAVHDGQHVLLEWHDAFNDVPMYIHSRVPLASIRAFADALGVNLDKGVRRSDRRS